jgi:5-methylcytosine-specific restriction enzyme subunit McrC
MKRLTIRERDALPYGVNAKLTEEEASAFASLQPQLPNGTLSWEHRAIRFGPFCGVLRAGNVTLELLPKIDDGSDSDETGRGLLVGMLRATGELRVATAGDADLGQQRTHLLDIFIRNFCDHVRLALRGGAISHYVEKTENLYAIRGRLQLTEHLSRNAFDRSRLYCRFDERTIDNVFNQILKSVLQKLLDRSISSRTKAMVAALLHRFHEVSDRRFKPDDYDKLTFDRTMKHWLGIFERARWLMNGLFPDVRLGAINGSFLLFNMETLFESMLGIRMRHALFGTHAGQRKVDLQGPHRHLAESGFLLRPDISVHDGEKFLSVIDAKWKRLDPAESNSGVSSADAYQMTAYANRYGCNHLALVYPASLSCPPGLIKSFVLRIPNSTRLDVVAVDLQDLTFGEGIPEGLG